MRIVDLTLPVETGMAGIPKIAFYEHNPVKVEAVTVVDEAQRPLLEREGVHIRTGAQAVNSMNTVFTLNSHVGTHIDAVRHFYADGDSIDLMPLEHLVLREAVVIDVSHVAPGTGVNARHLDATGVRPRAGQIAVVKTLWTERAWGKPEFWDNISHVGAERRRMGGELRYCSRRHGLLPREAVLDSAAHAGGARSQSQALAEIRHPDDADADQSGQHRGAISDDRPATATQEMLVVGAVMVLGLRKR